MSVPAYARTESPLKVLTQIDKIFEDAVKISKNEAAVPKKDRMLSSEPLLNTIRNILYLITAANSLNCNNEEDMLLRHQKQKEAFILLCHAIVDVKFCMKFSKDSASISKLSKILVEIDDTKNLLKTWMRSDTSRNSSFDKT